MNLYKIVCKPMRYTDEWPHLKKIMVVGADISTAYEKVKNYLSYYKSPWEVEKIELVATDNVELQIQTSFSTQILLT